MKLTNNEVLTFCADDAHGAPIMMKADELGIEPTAFIDEINKSHQISLAKFGIEYTNYYSTHSNENEALVSEIYLDAKSSGYIYKKEIEQCFDEEKQMFLADRYVIGDCPKCFAKNQYGDGCEECGATYSATDLINPKSSITGNVPTLKETKHWFLPLDKHEAFLREWVLEGHKKDWKPNVYGQVKSWVEDGLRPRAVTRDLDWGIPVPVEGGEGKVLYVWFDAPIGYISSTKEWAAREGKNWEDYWKKKDTELVHFIGKDNIVFHCIIFPSMLKAHGDYILPENVPANEFLNLEGNKLSTSKNWAVWLHEYLEEFPGQQDVLRYTLTANAPESKDNDFTWKDFQAKNNNELVAIFGNFINRVVVLTNKYYTGEVPLPGTFTTIDEDVLAAVKEFPNSIGKSIERYRFREASQELMNLARLGNKYLADEEPWKVIKVDAARVQTIMYVALQISAALAVVSEPFLPFTSSKLKAILNIDNMLSWSDVHQKEVLLAAKHQINKAALLFSKIEDKSIEAQLEKLLATKRSNAQEKKVVAPQKEVIDFEGFSKLDLRVGTIIAAEKVAKTKKLLQLKVDVGIDVRTIVSGIAESFSPEDIIGQQVSVLVNLAPRKIRGVESQGMILMTDTPDGKLAFVAPERSIKNGQEVS